MLNQGDNTVKSLIKNGKRVSAAWLQGGNPIFAEIMARAGFDTLFIDLEHGPGGIATLIPLIQAMQGYQAVPFVRAAWNDFVHIKQILDAGVYGLHVPYVNTAEEARAAVAAAKYPPAGIRGIAGSTRAAGFGVDPIRYLSRANEEICVLTAVETMQAVENLDEILEVEGVDMIFIGPMDLATNMGFFADPEAVEVQDVIRKIERKVLSSGKGLASVAGDWKRANDLYDKGYQLVIYMSDVKVMSSMSEQQVELFNMSYPQR